MGLILGLCTANERRRYFVTTSPIGWAQTENQPSTVCSTSHEICLQHQAQQSGIYSFAALGVVGIFHGIYCTCTCIFYLFRYKTQQSASILPGIQRCVVVLGQTVTVLLAPILECVKAVIGLCVAERVRGLVYEEALCERAGVRCLYVNWMISRFFQDSESFIQ